MPTYHDRNGLHSGVDLAERRNADGGRHLPVVATGGRHHPSPQLRPPHRHRGRGRRGAAGPADADRAVRPADDRTTGHRLARLARLRPDRLSCHRHPAHRAGPDLLVVSSPPGRVGQPDRRRAVRAGRSGRSSAVTGPAAVPAAGAGGRDRRRLAAGDRVRGPLRRRRHECPQGGHRHPRHSPGGGRDADRPGQRPASGQRDGPGLLSLGGRPGQRPATRRGAARRRPDRWHGGRARRGSAAAVRAAVGRGHVLRHRQPRVLLRSRRLAGVHPAARHHGAGERGRPASRPAVGRCAGHRGPTERSRSRHGRRAVDPAARPTGDHDEPLSRTWSTTPSIATFS